ncbi:MAG TPA: oligosaccharide flippase family protein [Candidatus Xenobia bacterium]|jgi:O-antigen/teichoic acid export membrane protein
MLVLCLLLLFLLSPAGRVDPDLTARFDMAGVPGISFAVAQGERLPDDHVKAEPRYRINWKSAPAGFTPIRYRGHVDRVLLSTEGGQPLLVSDGHTVVVTMATDGAIRRWLYFNYLLHAAAADAAGAPCESFAGWPASPVPGARSRGLFVLAVAALWTAFGLGLGHARRLGRARPEAALAFFEAVDRAARGSDTQETARWTQAGFARPLAGLLTLLAAMTFMVGVFFLIQWALSSRIQPFPEADGLWRSTYDTLIVVASLFDMGSGLAAIKYFAEDRVRSPQEALADFQFYLWWSMGQRLVQVTLLGALAVWFLPAGDFAIYAPFVALFGFTGLPALFQAGKNMCAALQRYDYQNVLDIIEQRVLFFLAPIPCILAGRAWGASHPMFGEAFGAALGMGLGTLVSNVLVLLVGYVAVRKLGVPVGPLFLVQFDSRVARKMLLFGGKISIGSEPIFLLKSVESIIIVRMMADFTAWLGVHQLLTGRFIQLYFFTTMFFCGALASISEAWSAHKRHLTQYYISRFMQYGGFVMMLIFSLLAAIGPAFVHALGPQWDRAQPYLWLALVPGLFYAPVWISDQVQQGTGRPGLFLITMGVEQGSRLLLFLVLVPRFQFAGVFMATGLALVIKGVFGWTLNHLTIVPLQVARWQTLGASALVGVVNFALWKAVFTAWMPGSDLAVVLGLGVASGMSIFLGFFVYGLAGGLDTVALQELAQAADMCTFVPTICRTIVRCASLGARLAPWRPGVPALAALAFQEAAELDAATHHR